MNQQAPTAAQLEAYMAEKTHGITAAEYQALNDAGYRFMAHGLLNRPHSWVKEMRVHKGFAKSNVDYTIVEMQLQIIRSKNV